MFRVIAVMHERGLVRSGRLTQLLVPRLGGRWPPTISHWVRACLFRTGIALGSDDGALQRMLPASSWVGWKTGSWAAMDVMDSCSFIST